MGWSSGTEIVETVANAIKEHVTDKKVRRKLYAALVDACQSADWDCENEACGIDPILDKILGCGEEEDYD